MKILEPNTGKETQPIYKNDVFVSITDYGMISILREVRVKFGDPHSKWIWLKLKEGELLLIGSEDGEYNSFDEAVNRMVNNPYCTVYDFNSYRSMLEYWSKGKIVYKDNITTIYKSEKKED